jgi:hypothetical protein
MLDSEHMGTVQGKGCPLFIRECCHNVPELSPPALRLG